MLEWSFSIKLVLWWAGRSRREGPRLTNLWRDTTYTNNIYIANATMFSPLFRSSIVVAVLVLSCGTAAASEEAEMESFLRKPRVDVGTSRILDSSCPPGEELFYNAYFTLCDEDGGATEKCDNPEDEEEMGRAIRNIVSNVDRDFPAWQDSSLSSINTTVCIFPSFSMEGVELEDIDERRELTQKKRRKKKSYTYTRYVFTDYKNLIRFIL